MNPNSSTEVILTMSYISITERSFHNNDRYHFIAKQYVQMTCNRGHRCALMSLQIAEGGKKCEDLHYKWKQWTEAGENLTSAK